MKVTKEDLKKFILETQKRVIAGEEAVIPGAPDYSSGEPIPDDEAYRLGHGVWPGGSLDEDEIEVNQNTIDEIVIEGIMLARLGVLDQFDLDLDAIKESVLTEAKYQGREVKLGKPMKGDVKKYKVYVKDPKTGNVKKVNFGDPNMQIRRDNPKARKSFRARHGCGTKRASNRLKAAYWACRLWSTKPVSKILKGK